MSSVKEQYLKNYAEKEPKRKRNFMQQALDKLNPTTKI